MLSTEASAAAPLLEVRDLRVRFTTNNAAAVTDVSFHIAPQERLAIVGESGCGKSAMAMAILGLTQGAEISGEVNLRGRDLRTLPARELRKIRGKDVAYIFQDSLSALDPVRTVGDQVTEVLRVHGVSRKAAAERARAMLQRVGIGPDRMSEYPHQFSGGMRQRVVIAMALVAEPSLVIADEPTTALDVRVQAQVMDLLLELARERDVAVILISHDLGIVRGFADRVMVMYAGRCVESGPTAEVFTSSIHPYTLGLLRSVPNATKSTELLPTIGGHPPAPGNLPTGCAFHPRCQMAKDVCLVSIPLLTRPPHGEHPSACHFAEELAVGSRKERGE